MPRYTYRCEKCEYELNVIHKMSETLTVCPICDGNALVKIPSKILSTIVPTASKRPGAIVDNFIEKAKEQLSEEKRILKGREIK